MKEEFDMHQSQLPIFEIDQNPTYEKYLSLPTKDAIDELSIPKLLSNNVFDKTLICSYP